MSKIAVIYWSGTGNTEAMAEAVKSGATEAGAEVTMLTPDDVDPAAMGEYSAVAFGCPSMGAEVLEETAYQPMWDSIKASFSGKETLLFGSYDWGDGEWMRDWKEDASASGLIVIETVICQDAPTPEIEEQLKALAKTLV